MTSRAILLLALAGAAGAQDSFSPPLIGYIADAGIRPIAGTPGAARVLPAVPLDAPVAKIVLAPGQAFGIATPVDGTGLSVVQFGAVSGNIPVEEACVAADLVAWNRNATAAAVFSKDCAAIQVITGLPDHPQITKRIEVPDVTALALNSDGSVVAWSRDGETRTSGGSSWPVAASALAYTPDDASIALLDRERKSVSLAAAELTPLAIELDEPATLFFADQNTLLVADGRAVRTVNIATAEVLGTDCFCKPSVIEPTAMKGVFRITGLANGSVWLLERADAGSRTVFVPAPPVETEQ